MSYSPWIGEFFLLTVTDVVIIGAGVLVFRRWKERGDTVPVWVSLAMSIFALAAYLAVMRYLWLNSEQDPEQGRALMFFQGRLLMVLLFCLAFWIPPALYYRGVFLESASSRMVNGLTWWSVKLPLESEYPDSEEFEEARELAAVGDIDGAVEKYKSYTKKKSLALFAAVNLLEAHGRYEEAVEVSQQVVDISADSVNWSADVESWAEATFRIGVMYERNLNMEKEAIDLFRKIVVRAPESDRGRMALANLQRLDPSSDVLLDVLDAAYDQGPSDATPPGAGFQEPSPMLEDSSGDQDVAEKTN